MNKKHKITLIVIGILLCLSILISASYAYYIFNVSQSGSNVLQTDCFRVTYTDYNPINLDGQVPLSDEEGSNLTPYTFVVSNVCNYGVNYNINIETLSETTMDLNGVKVKLNNRGPQILGNITDNDSNAIVNNNAISSKTIKQGFLKANSYEYFYLRIYIDEDSTYEQTGNKSFSSKVVVTTTLNTTYSETMLLNGSSFNGAVKKLAGYSNGSISTVDSTITDIKRSQNPPADGVTTSIVSITNEEKPIYAWYDNGIIYLYSEASVFKMNSNIDYMFYNLNGITNLDLSIYDSTDVTSMSYPFAKMANLTNVDLSPLDTSSVTKMNYLFSDDTSLTSLDISSLDTSNVTDMKGIFSAITNLTSLDLSTLDTSKVTNMSSMFRALKGLTELDISHLNTSKVTDMSYMFSSMSNLTNLDLSTLDTSKVTNMSAVFSKSTSLTSLDISMLNTSSVTNMSSMFEGMTNLTSLNINNIDTSKVTDMSAMFASVTSIPTLDLSPLNTSNVTNMSGMFAKMSNLTSIDLSPLNTSNVTNVSGMLCELSSIQILDISTLDFTNVTKVDLSFSSGPGSGSSCSGVIGGRNLTTIYASANFDLPNLDKTKVFFSESNRLKGGEGTAYNAYNRTAEYARIDDPQNGKPGYFTLKTT